MDPSLCHVLGNCTSVMTFRVGTHLRRGRCLCCLTSGGAVFVFKDNVLCSSNSFCFKEPFGRGAAAVGQKFTYTCREHVGNGRLGFPIILGACCATEGTLFSCIFIIFYHIFGMLFIRQRCQNIR